MDNITKLALHYFGSGKEEDVSSLRLECGQCKGSFSNEDYAYCQSCYDRVIVKRDEYEQDYLDAMVKIGELEKIVEELENRQ